MAVSEGDEMLERLTFAAGTFMRNPKSWEARKAVRIAIKDSNDYRRRAAGKRLAAAVDEAERADPAARLDMDG